MTISISLVRAGVIFLGSFLVFQIQPIAGKSLLPFFGGSASVFAVSLTFFSLMLFIGYGYVSVLTQYSLQTQVRIHTRVILGSVLVTLASLLVSHSLFFSVYFFAMLHTMPAWGVLGTLLTSIGIPYTLITTTSPLLLYWYGLSVKRSEPYHLYALSNIASFSALVSYPFIIERYLNLSTHEYIWAVLFCIYTIGMFVVMRQLKQVYTCHTVQKSTTKISLQSKVSWILMSGLPATLLVATTTYVTQMLAPVPLLWILPLSVYLLTFVLAFKGWGGGLLNALFVIVSSYVNLYCFVYGGIHPVMQALLYVAQLGVVGLYLHARLYAQRPHKDALPHFFVFMSFGGFLGSLIPALVTPLIFDDFYELPFMLLIPALIAVRALQIRMRTREYETLAVQGAILFVFLSMTYDYLERVQAYHPVLKDRSFYGLVKITDDDKQRKLTHGTTLHGLQFFDETLRMKPTTYYSATSGIGQVFTYVRANTKKQKLHIGVIGLGVGTLASYCKQGDALTFYEIDPRIVSIASTYFSYLKACGDVQVRVGDGRLLVKDEIATYKTPLDILIVDAFSDDAIPTHLITDEAVQLFLKRVDALSGVVVFHTSNRYIDLDPILFRIASEHQYGIRLIQDVGNLPGASASTWVLISHNPQMFSRGAPGNFYDVARGIPLWKDSYTNVLPVLKFDILDVFASIIPSFR